MPAWLIVILSILAVVLVAFIVLMIVGGRLQKKANSQQEALASAAQTVSMLIIDKEKLKNLEQYLKNQKNHLLQFWEEQKYQIK